MSSLQDSLLARIVDVPDFPMPGLVFKDVSGFTPNAQRGWMVDEGLPSVSPSPSASPSPAP